MTTSPLLGLLPLLLLLLLPLLLAGTAAAAGTNPVDKWALDYWNLQAFEAIDKERAATLERLRSCGVDQGLERCVAATPQAVRDATPQFYTMASMRQAFESPLLSERGHAHLEQVAARYGVAVVGDRAGSYKHGADKDDTPSLHSPAMHTLQELVSRIRHTVVDDVTLQFRTTDRRTFSQLCEHLPWLTEYASFHADRVAATKRGTMGNTRFLEYSCPGGDADVPCGGMGERFRGMVSALYVAMASRRVLLINSTRPGPLTEIFASHGIEWDFDPRGYMADMDVQQSIYQPKVFTARHSEHINADLMYPGRLHQLIGYRVAPTVILPMLVQRPQYASRLQGVVDTLRRVQDDHLLLSGCVLRTLFRHTTAFDFVVGFARAIRFAHLSAEGLSAPPVIGMHYRHPPPGSFPKFVRRALDLQQSYALGNDTLWFVASDSSHFKRTVRTQYPVRVVTLQMPRVHIDSARLSDPGAFHQQWWAYAEMVLLAESDLLITSDSSFSDAAAAYGLHTNATRYDLHEDDLWYKRQRVLHPFGFDTEE